MSVSNYFVICLSILPYLPMLLSSTRDIITIKFSSSTALIVVFELDFHHLSLRMRYLFTENNHREILMSSLYPLKVT